MKAFLMSLAVLALITGGAYFGLKSLEQPASQVFKSDRVRL